MRWKFIVILCRMWKITNLPKILDNNDFHYSKAIRFVRMHLVRILRILLFMQLLGYMTPRMDLAPSWGRKAISRSSYLDILQLSRRHNLSARPRWEWSAIKTSSCRRMKRREKKRSRLERNGTTCERWRISIFSENSRMRRWEKVLSDILDRMCAASHKVVQFINVIYEETRMPSRSHGQLCQPTIASFPVYSSCIESIEFCFTYPPREEKSGVFMHSCVHAYTSHRCVTRHLRAPLVSADLSHMVRTIGRSFGLKCSRIPIHKLKRRATGFDSS